MVERREASIFASLRAHDEQLKTMIKISVDAIIWQVGAITCRNGETFVSV